MQRTKTCRWSFAATRRTIVEILSDTDPEKAMLIRRGTPAYVGLIRMFDSRLAGNFDFSTSALSLWAAKRFTCSLNR